MKKIIATILLVSLSNLLFGCYSYESITLSELSQFHENDKPNEILVTTKDSQKYKFSNPNFYVEQDTLYGKGELVSDEGEKPVETKIALSDIAFIEKESFDLGNTCLWSGGIYFGIIIIVGTIALIIVGSNKN